MGRDVREQIFKDRRSEGGLVSANRRACELEQRQKASSQIWRAPRQTNTKTHRLGSTPILEHRERRSETSRELCVVLREEALGGRVTLTERLGPSLRRG
jgi:hypothetical protein